jgi:hypothetical protein
MSVGDLRVRSVCMAVSAALMYKVIGFNTIGFIGKTRNIAISFGLMGYLFTPELFNPFIIKSKIPLVFK